VYTEHLSVDDGSQREEVKYLTAGFPDRSVTILSLTFFIETIDLCDLPRFVISSDESYAVWVSRPNIS
jgi:hypothetical protein